jgi:hypothetical protein
MDWDPSYGSYCNDRSYWDGYADVGRIPHEPDVNGPGQSHRRHVYSDDGGTNATADVRNAVTPADGIISTTTTVTVTAAAAATATANVSATVVAPTADGTDTVRVERCHCRGPTPGAAEPNDAALPYPGHEPGNVGSTGRLRHARAMARLNSNSQNGSKPGRTGTWEVWSRALVPYRVPIRLASKPPMLV